MKRLIIALALLLALPASSLASTRPVFSLAQARGALNAPVTGTGASSWLRWSFRKDPIHPQVTASSCFHPNKTNFTCAVGYSYNGDRVVEWFINCYPSAAVHAHRWVLDLDNWVDRPVIVVHRPAKGKKWVATRDGGIICGGHEVRGTHMKGLSRWAY